MKEITNPKESVIVLFWAGFFWLLFVSYLLFEGYTGYPRLQENEILLLCLPPLVCFLPMLYLSLQSRIFKILSGFPGLSFKKKRKEEENLIKATIKAKDSKAFSSDIATLFIAAQKGLPDVLRALLLSTKVDINATSPNGVTALSLAASKGYIEVVKALLAAKADVNVTTKNGLTALILAIHEGRIEIVKALLEAKANVNATISMKGKTYTLLSIIPERHKETISLLKEYGAK